MDQVMEQLDAFWAVVLQVWHTGVFGAPLGRYLLAVVIMIGFLMIRHLFSVVVIGFIKRLTKKTTTDIDDRILETLEGPLKFVPVVLGVFLALQALPLEEGYRTYGEETLNALIYFVFFWAAYNLVEPVGHVIRRVNQFLTGAIMDWLIRGMKVFVVLLGAAAILENFGIPVAPIIGGLGLFGVAVALGAQDMFKNLIAGVTIIAERRFRKGDWIKVEGIVEGIVEEIGFRSTHVRRFDKAPVYVPNAELSFNPLTNFSRMTFRRIYWIIGVTYDTNIEQLRQIREGLEAYILESDDFVSPEEASTFVRIDKFNDSSIDIMVYCFTRTTVWGEWLQCKERLAYQAIEVVEGAGSSFAFPSQSLYVETFPDDAPEVFVPPKAEDASAKAPAASKTAARKGGSDGPKAS